MRRGFLGAAGKAIARGSREGRLIAIRAQRFSQNSPLRSAELYALDRMPDPAQLPGVGGNS
jgi:hypothetical protein